VLDDKPALIGRAIVGVPVVATLQNLEPVIKEFAVHGVRTNRVIIGGDEGLLSKEELARIRQVCEQREIGLDFVPRLIGLSELQAPPRNNVELKVVERWSPVVSLASYFRFKRFVDFVVAIAAIIVLSPLFLTACLLVMLDVGSPVLFWQQRTGQGGISFPLYKFRTLRPPFDWHGEPVPEDQRLSWIGHFLRKTRLDELPQLFNVLVGDMSLIGPRPLLPHDQPMNPATRLSVRPGITGWAQVNGGNLVTVDEKGALDEWYIRNASLWLDLRIAGLTLLFLFTGERRSEQAVVDAYAVQKASYLWQKPAYSKTARNVGPAYVQGAGRAINSMAGATATRRTGGSRPRQ
jgi:lipopolysaccharide/colanic/teichoic acid biosynthesis glycosyltransferase